MPSPQPRSDPPSARRPAFIIGFGLAQAGAFIAFIPLLGLLLPDHALRIAGERGAAGLVSQAAIVGGLVAMGSNLLFGALSDRSSGRLGRRRPWILAGATGVAACLCAFPFTHDAPQLLALIVMFQLAVNMLYGPLLALVPDMVPDVQKGVASAWAGAALPVANLFTAVVVTRLLNYPIIAHVAVAVAVLVAVVPFALRLREPGQGPGNQARPLNLSLAALAHAVFRRAMISRVLVEGAVAVNTLYLLLWLRAAPASALAPGAGATGTFGVLLATSTVAAAICGFAGGAASDRWGGRRGFVVAGAVGMGAALALMLVLPTWPGVLVAQLLFGAAHGLHASTVAAMTAEILPDRDQAGRDLGLMNVAIALPQSLAPAAALMLLGGGGSLSRVFVMAVGLAIAGAAVLTWRAERARPVS